eukprot:scaffold1605_cov129-Chaetoceros_neogracile.AAC.2
MPQMCSGGCVPLEPLGCIEEEFSTIAVLIALISVHPRNAFVRGSTNIHDISRLMQQPVKGKLNSMPCKRRTFLKT